MATPKKTVYMSYIHFSYFHTRKTHLLIDLLAEKMEKECGLRPGEIFNRIERAKSAPKTKDTEAIERTGFLLLHDGKELLCASLMDYATVITRWVPPKHRGKGYATLMLESVDFLFEDFALPVWVISYERMDTINTRAGWIKNPGVNKSRTTGEIDPTVPKQHDWFPPSKEAVYRSVNGWTAEQKKGFRKEWMRFLNTADAMALDLKVRL